jgi:uncharacterized membrane protein
MSGKIFGVTWGLIFLVLIAMAVGARWGTKIPLIKMAAG